MRIARFGFGFDFAPYGFGRVWVAGWYLGGSWTVAALAMLPSGLVELWVVCRVVAGLVCWSRSLSHPQTVMLQIDPRWGFIDLNIV